MLLGIYLANVFLMGPIKKTLAKIKISRKRHFFLHLYRKGLNTYAANVLRRCCVAHRSRVLKTTELLKLRETRLDAAPKDDQQGC